MNMPTLFPPFIPKPQILETLSRHINVFLGVMLLMTPTMSTWTFADDSQTQLEQEIADQAKAAWLGGATNPALEILDQGIASHPQALTLQKLRGDVLATVRRPQEAIAAYDAVLQHTPEALNVRWAKWSALLRSGKSDQAIDEFQRIVQLDTDNPLVPLRLAQELRKIDRLEESLGWYKKAVELTPNMPGWRLAMARAQFDILDGRGARDEVKRVLKMVDPDSPEELAARNLLAVVYGATKERGRRYQYIFTPEGTAAERKEWASIRADAWNYFDAGRFQEAEPLYRRILALNPSDATATHELGMTLIGLDRCDEAIKILDVMHTMNPSDEIYADTIYRVARCLMKTEKWTEALLYFEVLHEAAVEFEEATKEVPPEADKRYLNKEMLAGWIAKVKEHLPRQKEVKDDANEKIPFVNPTSQEDMTEEELFRKLAREKLNPDKKVHRRASLMGRDADFSLFRYVIPANQVMRDDLPTGAHDFIPINPGDTYAPTQQEIYLVFGLVTASFDEIPLSVECHLETSKISEEQPALAQDHIAMAMNEQTGYFMLTPPETGWPIGLHRCGLYVGNEVSAYTHTDEVRFRIMEPTPMS